MHLHRIREFIKEYGCLFWWVKESEKENINLNALVESVLNYGDIACIKKLFDLLGIKKVAEIFLVLTDFVVTVANLP